MIDCRWGWRGWVHTALARGDFSDLAVQHDGPAPTQLCIVTSRKLDWMTVASAGPPPACLPCLHPCTREWQIQLDTIAQVAAATVVAQQPISLSAPFIHRHPRVAAALYS